MTLSAPPEPNVSQTKTMFIKCPPHNSSQDVELDEDTIYVSVSPESFQKAKDVLAEMGITEFEEAEVRMEPNEYVTLYGEDLQKFQDLVDALDELEDVQNVAHNVEL